MIQFQDTDLPALIHRLREAHPHSIRSLLGFVASRGMEDLDFIELVAVLCPTEAEAEADWKASEALANDKNAFQSEITNPSDLKMIEGLKASLARRTPT